MRLIDNISKEHAKKVVQVHLNVAKCCGACRLFNSNCMAEDMYGPGWGVCTKHKYDNGNGPVALVCHEVHFCSDEHWECDEDNTEVTNYICAALTKAAEGL